ncbi:hypothetical protein B4589_007340 [Halolamina sp. CBA1230]|uniref:hypothetical protein n=1 Tax=Halolamina sp. CBA1230 TaxID=1853690 RepID=UPI0009A1B858|nr:hypothetical protein [Halolamina sp. CBA1230]QKY20200.1 hypothetical protein B4589_007340 [Halolamina sp. CBA1230]
MGDIVRRSKHRFGQLFAAFLLLFTLAFVPTGYDMWQATPAFVDYEPFSLVYNLVFFAATAIPVVVGLYLTRNAYRWSKRHAS